MHFPLIQCPYFPFPHLSPLSLTRFEGISYGELTRKRRLSTSSNGIRLFLIRKREAWVLKIWDFTIKFHCASGFGISIQKKSTSGDLLFAPNMVYLQCGPLTPSLPLGLRVWKHIRAFWDLLGDHSYFRVGNRRKFSFWHDPWLGHSPLKELFPVLFRLTSSSLVHSRFMAKSRVVHPLQKEL